MYHRYYLECQNVTYYDRNLRSGLCIQPLLALSCTHALDDHSCPRVVLAQSVTSYFALLPPIGAYLHRLQRCKPGSTSDGSLVFAGLRAYALTQRRWLSVLIFLLSGVQFITNMVRHRSSLSITLSFWNVRAAR